MSARTFNASKPGRYGTVTVFEDENGMNVQLHRTVVARLQAGTIELNSGGWKTVVTKTAINTALRQWGCPAAVVQENWEWFVNGHVFRDGMEIDQRSGKLVGLPISEVNLRDMKRQRESFQVRA